MKKMTPIANLNLNFKIKFLLALITLCMLQSCAYKATAKFSYEAKFDKEEARKAILALKNEPIVVVLPSFQRKEYLLKQVNKEKAFVELNFERETLNRGLVDHFTNHFTFTDVLFIPDSLVNDFEDGMEKAFFVNQNMQLDPEITLTNRSPYKIIFTYDRVNIYIVNNNNIVPNPFPCKLYVGHYDSPGVFIGLITKNWNVKDLPTIVKTINGRLERFHDFHNQNSKYFDVREDIK